MRSKIDFGAWQRCCPSLAGCYNADRPPTVYTTQATLSTLISEFWGLVTPLQTLVTLACSGKIMVGLRLPLVAYLTTVSDTGDAVEEYAVRLSKAEHPYVAFDL